MTQSTITRPAVLGAPSWATPSAKLSGPVYPEPRTGGHRPPAGPTPGRRQTANPEKLLGVVQDLRALPGVQDVRLETVPYTVLSASTDGVYRVRIRTNTRTLRAVLKLTKSPALFPPRHRPEGWGQKPGHADYWKREVLAYQSGDLKCLPAGMRAPIAYHIRGHLEYTVVLVEDLSPLGRQPSCTADLERCARGIGVLNGSFLGDHHPLLRSPWLSQNWLTSWITRYPADREALALAWLPETWNNDIVSQAFPSPIAPRLLSLSSSRDTYLRGLQVLPPTFCHLDATHRNLFLLKDGQIAAIDWAFAGKAALGEDLAPLIATACLYGQAAEDTALLDQRLFPAYLQGLAETGWEGDPRIPRLGYCIHSALRFGLSAGTTVRIALEPDRHASISANVRLPIRDYLERRASTAYYALDLADEARTLLREFASSRRHLNVPPQSDRRRSLGDYGYQNSSPPQSDAGAPQPTRPEPSN